MVYRWLIFIIMVNFNKEKNISFFTTNFTTNIMENQLFFLYLNASWIILYFFSNLNNSILFSNVIWFLLRCWRYNTYNSLDVIFQLRKIKKFLVYSFIFIFRLHIPIYILWNKYLSKYWNNNSIWRCHGCYIW